MRTYWRILRETALGDNGGSGASTTAFDISVHAPADIRQEPSLAGIKTVQDLTKGYVSAQKMIGAKRIAIPGETARPEEWGAFYDQIGRPDAPEKYGIPEIKDLDESLKPDPARIASVQKKMHELGLTPKQFRGLMEYHLTTLNEQVKGSRVQSEQQSTAAVGTLKQEWGDKFDSNVDVARSVVKKFGGQEFADYLEKSGMGNNIPLIKMLHKFGTAILEDKDHGGNGAGLELTDSTRALQEIENLKVNPDFQKALNDPRAPGHKDAVNRWTNLFSAAHPGKEKDGQ